MTHSAQGRPQKPIAADADPRVAALAEALRSLRQRAGLSLRELAAHTHYSAATLSNAASGRNLPHWGLVQVYARGCSASANDVQRLRLLWESASAAKEDRTGTSATPRSATPESDTPRHWLGRRPPSVPTELSFADVVSPDKPAHQPTAPPPRLAPAQGRRPAPAPQRELPPHDPGDSLPGLVRQARRMSTSAHPGLELCTTPKHFIDLMENLRQTSGLSLRDLSNRCKHRGYAVSKSTLHDLLNGRELPSTEVLHAFLHATGSDPDDWMTWHQTRTRLKIAQLLNDPKARTTVGMMSRDRFTRSATLTAITALLITAQIILAFLS
ncbi:helix-turn-helix domain-containing protein [Streptomyces zhihengii]